MRIAVLVDSKFGNTLQVAAFLAQELQAAGHEAKVFRTKQVKPEAIVEFKPEVLLAGAPTHAWKPSRTLLKYIKNIGKSGSTTITKAAAFNCYMSTITCPKIEKKITDSIPNVEIFQNSLPIQVLGMEGPLPDDWKESTTAFIEELLPFLS